MPTITPHYPGQYVICGGADQHWRGTAAKTLRGAKIAAARAYNPARGGTIEVAQVLAGQYCKLAVRHGYDAWQQA